MRGREAAFFLFSTALGCSSSGAPEIIGVDHSLDTGAAGFCRTTTCPPPDGYPLSDGTCQPADWSDSDSCVKGTADHGPASNAPLFWRTACVGYDPQKDGSRHVAYDAFAAALANAFFVWTSASCPSAGLPTSRVSVEARDLGPVDCTRAEYDRQGPNQNLVVFHDDAWPHEEPGVAKSPTIALTTVTFDPDSGEIYDADIELNSADHTIVPLSGPPPDGDTFDLQAVLTHEVGHFFGLAHSPRAQAVMYASGDSSSGQKKRALTSEDVSGICAIYPPGGTRAVSLLVDPSGSTPESACDPTPRHGFTAECAP